VTLAVKVSTLPKTGFGRVILPDIASKLNAALGKPWFEVDEALTALPDRVPSTISAYITAWPTAKWNQMLTEDGISYSLPPTVQDPRNTDMTQKAAGERWTKLTSENSPWVSSVRGYYAKDTEGEPDFLKDYLVSVAGDTLPAWVETQKAN